MPNGKNGYKNRPQRHPETGDGESPLHNLDAEKIVIGKCVCEPGAFAEIVAKGIKASDFYDTKHQLIYEACDKLTSANVEIDDITICDTLNASGDLGTVGIDYIGKLGNLAVTKSAYAASEIVLRLSVQRRLSILFSSIRDIVAAPSSDLSELSGKLHEPLEEAMRLTRAGDEGREKLSDIVSDVRSRFEDAIAGRLVDNSKRHEVSWAVRVLDEKFRPLVASEGDFLIVVAAEPGVGKSSLARQMALQEIVNGGLVQCFLLETSAKQFIGRCAGLKSGLPFKESLDAELFAEWKAAHDEHVPVAGRLNPGEGLAEGQQRLAREDMDARIEAHRAWLDCLASAADKTLFVHEQAASLPDIVARARLTHRAHGRTDLLVVDYLQEVSHPLSGKMDGHEVIGDICRTLKRLAKHCGCPCVLISSLNRDKEGGMPTKKNLRGSGDIEFAADRIIFIHRPNEDASGSKQSDERLTIQLQVRQDKARDLPLFTVWTDYCRPLTRFEDPAGGFIPTDARGNTVRRGRPLGAKDSAPRAAYGSKKETAKQQNFSAHDYIPPED